MPHEEDVVRLDIAVNDAKRMRVTERVSDVAHDANHVCDRKRSLPDETIAQRLAFDVRHRVVQQPVGLSDEQHRHDVRMVNARREPDLAVESVDAERPRQLRGQHLHDDAPVERAFLGHENARHAAAAQLAIESVGAGE